MYTRGLVIWEVAGDFTQYIPVELQLICWKISLCPFSVLFAKKISNEFIHFYLKTQNCES
jgi:hypothetical protein